MTALNKYAALRQLAEESTQGEWWSDVVETDGEYGDGEDRASGYHSYAVYVGSESLLDMTNSTAACIHEEYDHDYHMAWDETAKRNAEFIAAANPSTVLALLDELETKEEQRANWFQMAQKLGEDLDAAEKRIAEHNFENRLLANADRDIKALRERIAELEAVREVFLRAKALMYQSGGAPIENSLNPIDAWLYDAELIAAGIGVKGD
ncbi:ead/Ea22-like family protein [Citrobacter freundii]|uniref:ead/Ea22-like family protein n=1 Tax=Citrobacter freundii TaxID=546 RepID=UPI00292ACAD6|nr:ead/Ea22-like family protein [Citrobacter freundii]MEB0335729.1 ead/Ea22-like family protein [Citrobacter freundii]HED6947778.1 ead/Ea22-like family protein [Citrobacter freundii]